MDSSTRIRTEMQVFREPSIAIMLWKIIFSFLRNCYKKSTKLRRESSFYIFCIAICTSLLPFMSSQCSRRALFTKRISRTHNGSTPCFTVKYFLFSLHNHPNNSRAATISNPKAHAHLRAVSSEEDRNP